MKLGRALVILIAATGLLAFAAPADAHWVHGHRGWGWHGRPARVWWGGPRWGWGPRRGWWGPRAVVGYPYGYWGYPYPAYGYGYPPPAQPYASQKVYNGRRTTNEGAGKDTVTHGDY